ncbi:MAG: hypothetical protein SGBAC_003573 [Bacillariaceae sp.]
MKFKPLCYDYHSEASSLWLERFPSKETEPLRINISTQILLDQDENEGIDEACTKEVEEASNEQEKQPLIVSPLVDSTNQANGIPTTARASNTKIKKSKSVLNKIGTDNNTPQRRCRRKRRRDSPTSLSPKLDKEKPGADPRSKHNIVSAKPSEQHVLPSSVKENPLQGDPRNGKRQWIRRKLPTFVPDSETLVQTQYSKLEAKEKGSKEHQSKACENEPMDCDLDSSPKGESAKSAMPPASSVAPQGSQEKTECQDSLQIDLVETLLEGHATQLSKNDMLQPNRIVEHSSPCSSPDISQRIKQRRRQRRLVNAIGGSTLGSNGIIVLPPKSFSIYDSPLLVSILTNIRRNANRKRITNYAWWSESSRSSQLLMMEENAVRACFWRHPTVRPHFQCLISFWWRRRMEIAIFRQFSRTISNVATAKLDQVLSLLTVRYLSNRDQGQRPISIKTLAIPKTPKAEQKVFKTPYRYCLLDILQGNAGIFWNVSIGSLGERRETRKRELKAMVPYASSRPSSHHVEVQQRLKLAILLAWNVANQQQEGRYEPQDQAERHGITENQSWSAKKRKVVDSTELRPRTIPSVRKSPACTEEESVAARNSSTSIEYGLPTIHNAAHEPNPSGDAKKESAKVQPQEESDQARQTELSLLERFGLAPSTESSRNMSRSTQARNKRPPQPTISAENSRQPKRGKLHAKQHSISKSSDLEISPSAMQCDIPVSLSEKKRDVNHINLPVRSDEQVSSPKQSSILSSQLHQQPSCQPTSEVTSSRNLAERSEHYKNWQPKNFDLDDGSVWSSNNDNDSGIQEVTTPTVSFPKSRIDQVNLPSTVASPGHSWTQSPAPPTPQPQTTSRVVTDKKQRKRARKAAKKKKKDHKRKSGKRSTKKKSHRGLFDQSLPESVLQSLEEDGVEEERPQMKENCRTPSHQVSALAPVVKGNGSPDQPIVLDDGNDMEDCSSISLPQRAVRPPVLLLCSEDFLETWGDAAGRLVSGDWQTQISSHRHTGESAARRFSFVDTNLVDACGVDIELPDRGGIVVSAMSSWHSDSGFENLLMRVVGLISSTRFRHLSIFLCADVDQDDATIDRIAALQSAVLHQGDGLVTATSFTLVSLNALAASIGQSIYKLDASWGMEEVESWLLDDRTFERLLFLVRLIPTLTATSVLQCLMSSPVANGSTDDKSRQWFHSVFQDGIERKRMQGIDPKLLHPAVITQLSFALGVNIGDDTVFQS